ncbi:TPA: hypothetical protein DIT45_01945 [Candidatus Acetothermia bacterium]|nr:hypothetical protein [Candidatus Acetothermia bacterium]
MLTRRVVIGLIVGLLVFGVWAVSETDVPETPEASVGGTLVIGVSQTFRDLDPRISDSIYDWYVIGEVFDDLIALDPETLEPRPYVAKSWNVVSDKQIRFYLNQGIKFHNGEDLTAEDVAFTLNSIVDPENDSPNCWALSWMQEAIVVNSSTVDILVKAEYAPYAPLFSALNLAIVPKDTVLEMGDEKFNLNPIGSGPYKFVRWIVGTEIVLERNEDYWLVYPNLDRAIYRPIPTLSVMMGQLETGAIDIADNMPFQDIPRFQANPNVDVWQCPDLSYFYLFFNLQHAPGNDIRYREAVGMSIDMDEAIYAIFQGLTGIRAYGCIPPALWANDRDYLAYDIALEEDDIQANWLFSQLKAEGVISEDYETTIYCPLDPRRTQLATIIAESLKENGLDARVQSLDWGPYLDLINRSEADPLGEDFDQGIIGWSGGPDPHDFLYYLLHSDNAVVGAADNFSFYRNPEVDYLISTADTTLDQEKRERLYVEAQRLCFEEYVHIPLYHLIETKGVRTRVHGFRIDPLGGIHLCDPYHNVWVE